MSRRHALARLVLGATSPGELTAAARALATETLKEPEVDAPAVAPKREPRPRKAKRQPPPPPPEPFSSLRDFLGAIGVPLVCIYCLRRGPLVPGRAVCHQCQRLGV